MKIKVSFISNVLLLIVVIFMGTYIHIEKREKTADSEVITKEFYECMENPIDPLFSEALVNTHINSTYREIQKFYYETWKTQYETIMEKIREKCKQKEDIANYDSFVMEMSEGFDKMSPLILNEMLDNYDMPESPEKYGQGQGTNDRLLMYQGTMYRNACMFFIPLLDEKEYQFPVDEISKDIAGLLER